MLYFACGLHYKSVCVCVSRAMSPDELVYLGVLAASIPVGFLFRYLSEYFDQIMNTFIHNLYIYFYLMLFAGDCYTMR